MVDVKEVLERVNKLRIAIGMEPLEDLPKGVQHRTNSCPIARSLPKGWHVGTYQLMAPIAGISEYTAELVISNWGPVDESVTEDKDFFKNPEIITQFINEFDQENWPQYFSDEELKDDDLF